ncbi:hypothetical protein COV19_05560 [Candidatus Woesearchaeota archaeon CG10_big_fil_rev_8_21_14_0_10_44_13]|nr:MAG: hypothetical protein COV19_05560 [Candidatus Woesearchaeota archaeon CG10_big_fil_rev_8_21_14_0_10_44_13]
MISIIGAGPIGSYLGYLLSKNNIENTIVEEHPEIGRPEQCTGLISRNIEGIIEPSLLKKAAMNKVNGAVISCGKASFEVKTHDFKAYVFDRSKFDKAIAEKAENKGSKLLLGHSYIDHKLNPQTRQKGLKIGLNFGHKAKYLQSTLLVGADGPASKVAKNSSLYGDRKFWTGAQMILKAKEPFFDKSPVYVYLDKRYSDGFFAWVVPIDEERAKAGLASYSNTAEHLNRFLKDKFGHFLAERRSGGLIPVYNKMPLQNRQKNIFLVGDAALQVKATSGGGVVNGMLAAQGLADAISTGKFDYESRIRGIRRNLWLHSLIRKKLNAMGDARRSELIEDLCDEKIKNIMQEKGDMDFVAKFGFNVLAAKPSLLRFLLY